MVLGWENMKSSGSGDYLVVIRKTVNKNLHNS
jgi:hypothetical protein